MKSLFRIISAAAFLASPWRVSGQDGDHDVYDIGSYEPPDYTYSEFIIVPEIAINSIDSSYKNTNALSTETQAYSYSNSRYGLDPGHRFHLYSKKFEFGSYNLINSRYDATPWVKSQRQGVLQDEKDFFRTHDTYVNFNSSDTARLYYPSRSFISAAFGFGFVVENQKTSSGSALPSSAGSSELSYSKFASTMELFNPSFSVFVGSGWGRIRDVTFGAVALGMLDRLKEIHPQSRGIPADGVQDFASYIEKRRRLRVFDGRLSLIENINSLSSYLVDKKALPGPSSAATMELADQWEYAFSQHRQAGMVFSLSPGIIADYSRNVSSDNTYLWRDSLAYDLLLTDADVGVARKGRSYWERANRIDQRQTALTYCLNSSFRFAKPINRFLQISAQADINFHWNHYFVRSSPSDMARTDFEKLLPLLEADASCLLAYYPDTRTTFSFVPNVSYNRSYSYLINENRPTDTRQIVIKNDLHNDFRGIDVQFPLEILYYISPRLHYSISASTYLRSYYASDQSVTKAWYATYAFAAQLTYQIF